MKKIMKRSRSVVLDPLKVRDLAKKYKKITNFPSFEREFLYYTDSSLDGATNTTPAKAWNGKKVDKNRAMQVANLLGLSHYADLMVDTNSLQIPSAYKIKLATKKNIFLCHAKEDKSYVRNLNSELEKNGFNPWLDENDILPGKDWDLEIKKALNNSDIVLVVLSKKSVKKRGYVQREIKIALDIIQEIPEEDIFIIPVLLEKMEIPNSLKPYHAFRYYDESIDKLFTSLAHQLSKVPQS